MAKKLAAMLDMQPHPEGGFYKEVYRSEGSVPAEALDASYAGPRNLATHIYYLVTGNNFSALHRIRQD